MTRANPGDSRVDVTQLLTALAAAEQQATERAKARSVEYGAGVSDAYADVKALVREQAGWPREHGSEIADT